MHRGGRNGGAGAMGPSPDKVCAGGSGTRRVGPGGLRRVWGGEPTATTPGLMALEGWPPLTPTGSSCAGLTPPSGGSCPSRLAGVVVVMGSNGRANEIAAMTEG
jgi:hypothetical protein